VNLDTARQQKPQETKSIQQTHKEEVRSERTLAAVVR
jgi:hypothetical protein